MATKTKTTVMTDALADVVRTYRDMMAQDWPDPAVAEYRRRQYERASARLVELMMRADAEAVR